MMTTLSMAKAAHWLAIPKDQRGAFSMADIKTKYINELLLDRLISIYGKSSDVEKIILKYYNFIISAELLPNFLTNHCF
jgi:hypothetical protein